MSLTNVALNSRSLNGIITISDGTAVLENGDLTCEDINSASLTTNTINTSLLTCTGKFDCNLNGPYSIPTSISSITGLLISYGNTTNSGATDFTNYGSTYTSTQQGFRFWNKSNTQTLTNLAIIDNSQVYFKSQLTGCLAETPVNPTSVVNKTYVDSNFLDRTNNLTQNINGEKTFTNNLISNSQATFNNLTPICSVANPTAVNHLTRKDYVDGNFVDRTNNLTQNINGLKTFTNNCDFSAILSLKNKKELNQTQNIQTDTNYTLSFPFPETTVIRTITVPVNTITIILPAVSATERGLLFNFFKFKNGLNVIFQSTSLIFTLNNLSSGSTTNTTLLSSDKIMTTLMCGSFGTTYYWVEVNTYSTFDRDQNNLLYARLASPNAFTNTNTFNSFLPTSTLTPSLNTELITKKFADDTYINFTTDQTISGTKRFGGIFTTGLNVTQTLGGGGNRFYINMSNNIIQFVPVFNNNLYRFFVKDATTNEIASFETDYNSTVINNNLVSKSQATFDNFTPTCSVSSPSANNHLTRKDYVDNNFVDKITDQTITGIKRFGTIFTQDHSWATSTFTNRVQSYITGNYLVFMPQFNNNIYAFHCKDNVPNLTTPLTIDSGTTTIANNLASNAITYVKEIRWRDQGAGTEQQSYLSGTEFHFVALFNSNTYRFYCRDSGSAQTYPLTINSANTTIANNLVSNNLTSPSITGTNNIYTNLSLDGGIINIGARASNINIKCTLNINESVYGTSQNSIINMEGNSCRFNNTGSTNGNYIFTISEGTVYNPLVINKTSINLNGDATVSKNLILYDTTPSTKNVIIGMVGNDLFFTPSINTPSSSYNFKVNDSASTLTTPLIINSTDTTIANNLISNLQATFNNSTPICSVSSPTANNHLTRKDYVDNNFVDKTNTQTGIAGDKTFTGRLTNTFVIFAKDLSWLDAQGSGGRVQAYLSATDLGFISVNVNNNRYLFNTKDGAGNPTTPLLINSASTTISNNLVSNNLTSPTTTSTNNIYTSLVSGGAINIGGSLGTNNIYGSTTFNSSANFNVGVSFLGISSFNNGGTFTEIEQTSGSNLVIRNTTNSKKIILSTTSASTGQVDSLVINTTSCDILSPTLNLNSSSTINILTPNNLTGVINFLNTLTTATINFCSTAYTSIFNLNARLAHKGVQYMNEVKTISGTSPPALAFPLEQSWMFTSTGATQVVITLPEITASHQAGFNFIIFKTASNTNSVLFNRSGSNTIRGLNSITDVTSVTRLSGTNSVGVGFYTAEVSTGNFAWISY